MFDVSIQNKSFQMLRGTSFEDNPLFWVGWTYHAGVGSKKRRVSRLCKSPYLFILKMQPPQEPGACRGDHNSLTSTHQPPQLLTKPANFLTMSIGISFDSQLWKQAHLIPGECVPVMIPLWDSSTTRSLVSSLIVLFLNTAGNKPHFCKGLVSFVLEHSVGNRPAY